MTPRRVVLDTNVLVAALVFTSGRLAWIRHAWQHGTIVPLVAAETVGELVRVPAYPRFRLTHDERDDLLAELLPFAEVVTFPDPWPEIPECRDPHDRVFLALALVAGADTLVTWDADLPAIERLGRRSPLGRYRPGRDAFHDRARRRPPLGCPPRQLDPHLVGGRHDTAHRHARQPVAGTGWCQCPQHTGA